MKKVVFSLVMTMSICFTGVFTVDAQERTVGLIFNSDSAYVGYTLFKPMQYNTTYLIDNEGLLVHSWESEYQRGMAAYLLENGNLLRTAGAEINEDYPLGAQSGIVQEFSWDGSLVWEYTYSDDTHMLHHGIEPLPDGNVLMIAWEVKSREEIIDAGRDPALIPYEDRLLPDHIIEVEPDGQTGGNIVWEWHLWDHLIQDFDSTKSNYGIVEEHPELMDINFIYNLRFDWPHTNSVDYYEGFDQIVLSFHATSEIMVIDHGTTTEEAAGHTGGRYGRGGDFLYRWGNPRAYRAGTEDDRQLYVQHDARWIESGFPGDGNMTIFNNGRLRPEGDYSSVDEIVPPMDEEGYYYLEPDSPYGPEEPIWIYTSEDPFDFYSMNVSGAQRLPNGNTLICSGDDGEFFEVTHNGEVVWLYINPVNDDGPMYQGDNPVRNHVFNIYRYSPDYPGFEGRDLTPGDPIERYRTDIAEGDVESSSTFALASNHPNPFNASTLIEYNLVSAAEVTIDIYNILGRKVETLKQGEQQAGYYQVVWDASNQSSGTYFYRIETGKYAETRKMVLLK